MKNYFERCLYDALSDALKFKRGVRLGLYRISYQQGKILLYDTDILMAKCSICKKDIILSFKITAKLWQRKIIIDLLEKKFDKKFL